MPHRQRQRQQFSPFRIQLTAYEWKTNLRTDRRENNNENIVKTTDAKCHVANVNECECERSQREQHYYILHNIIAFERQRAEKQKSEKKYARNVRTYVDERRQARTLASS